MKVSRLRRLAIGVFKTLKSLNPGFINTYFKKGSHSARRKNDLIINREKTTMFVEKSLRTLGPKNLEFSTRRRQRLNFSSKIYRIH